MATTDKNTLKGWFLRGSKPLSSQFAAWLDSYWHKDDAIPMTAIENLDATLGSKANASALNDKADKISEDEFVSGKHRIVSLGGYDYEILDKETGDVLERHIDGQIFLYGRRNIANGAINLYTPDGKKRYIINTDQGNVFVELYNSSEELTAVLDSSRFSKLLGLDLQNRRLLNLADAEDYTDGVNLGQVKALIAQLVESAPETLDTLNELAAALGDDPNFATTVATAIGQKMAKSSNLSDVENRQTAVNNLFDASNLALGQTLVKDENGNMVAGEAGAVKSVNGMTGDVVIPTPVAESLVLWHNYGSNY